MVAGFTGSQKGCTEAQRLRFLTLISDFAPSEGRHGDCVGADSEFHAECLKLGIPIVIHPPENPSKRALNAGAALVLPPEDYLVRNRAIVDASDLLIACPGDTQELLRSGVWSTVRYARKNGKRVVIIFPDGGLSVGNYCR